MNQGSDDRQGFDAYRAAVRSLIVTFEQHQGFFTARIPILYQRLSYLVRRCRQLLHESDATQAHALLQEELFRLFGVRVSVPADKQLSVLAAVIRYVLVVGARMCQPLEVKGGIQLLLTEVRQQQCLAVALGETDLLMLDAKLDELSKWFPRGVNVLELRYFARLGLRDIAVELGADLETIKCEMRFAKAWLIAGLRSSGVEGSKT